MSAVSHQSRVPELRPVDQRAVGRRVRRWGLVTFFTSIGVNAALGVYAVLAPDFGETQSKILATSLFVTGAILVALACEPAWERRRYGPVPYLGAGLGAIGFALSILGMWAEIDQDVYGKTVATVFVASAALTAASLLALACLSTRHRWVMVTTLALLATGATLFGLLPWLGDDAPYTYVRILGVVLIALAALVVTVPVLHWVDRPAGAATDSADAVSFCPYCGAHLAAATGGDISCSSCGRRFRVLDAR